MNECLYISIPCHILYRYLILDKEIKVCYQFKRSLLFYKFVHNRKESRNSTILVSQLSTCILMFEIFIFSSFSMTL
jgi:hypothetical protein